jgi:adenylate cyclase
MVQDLFDRLMSNFERLGSDPLDSDEVRLQKVVFLSVVLRVMLVSTVWVAIYLAYAEFLSATILITFIVISVISVLIFKRTHHYHLFRFTQFLFILLIPFLLTLILGGFANSSLVVLWSLVCPMGALAYSNPRRAVYWFFAYLGLVLLAALLSPILQVRNNLPSGLIFALTVVNILFISGLTFSALYYFVLQKDRAFQLLRVEQQKSEQLLLNVLPPEIAAILKYEKRIIADRFEGASILFADVVNFTPLSTSMTPEDLVELLNEVFSYFDILVDKYGLEKIKTVGDCYMVASGVPRPRRDHASAIARLALDICDYSEKREGIRHLEFRVGINSGPVVAGVIGRKKFIYDLWGDAVNMASRMESHGTAGKIQITRETYELLKDEFHCESRGRIAIKGKGEMDTWYLLAIKGPSGI